MKTDVKTIATLLQAAERIAAELGDEQPGAEHLLAAALDLDESTVALGVTADDARAAITAVHARSLGSDIALTPSTRPLSGVYRSANSLQEVFQRTRMLSKGTRLTGMHVVRAAAERERGTVALVIDELGISRVTLDT
jgi:hypothetical protein